MSIKNNCCVHYCRYYLDLVFSFNQPGVFAAKIDSFEPVSSPRVYEDEYDIDKYTESMLPYGIQNVRDVLHFEDRPYRNKATRDLRV